MRTAIRVAVPAIAWLTLAGCAGDTIVGDQATQENRIYVSGTATVEAAPDMAQAQLGVQTFAKTVDEAMAENNTRTAAVLAALAQEGVAAKDLQTVSFNLYPQQDPKGEDPTLILGYWVNNTVEVKIRDLSRVGRVLQAGIAAGANTSYGLAFTLSDPDSLRQEARQEAVEDARNRAEALAEGAGVKLGKVIRIQESSSYYGPVYARADAAVGSGAEVPLQPGELEVTAQVEVVFEIR
jgi:uncharacterized protein YggE